MSNRQWNFFNFFSLNRVSCGLFNDTEGHAKLIKDVEKLELEEHIVEENIEEEKPQLRYEEIIQVDFPEHLYFKEQTNKKQIVLHHTVSGRGVTGDINWWKQNPSRIATAIIIDWKGDIYQLFSSRYWAHHLGVRADNNLALNKASIGIEIDSWGPLMKHNRNWYPVRWDSNLRKNVANTNTSPLPIERVYTYKEPYKGFYAYEKYTDEQIKSVRKLLVYWGNLYNIPLTYNENMWQVNRNALRGDSGVWSHTSFREDKSDAHPQPELIEMLKSLA